MNKQARIAIVGWGLVLGVALTGCATQQLPKTPVVQTAEGKACVRQCQANYTDCYQACPHGAMLVHVCIDDCKELLQGCYSTCE